MTVDIPAALAERVEAESLYDFETGTAEPAYTALGIAALRLGGGVALCVRNDPSGFWSRVLGIGFDEPVTADLVHEACAFLRAQGMASVSFQIAPAVLPEDWDQICAKEHITRGRSWVKLAGGVETVLARARERDHLADGLRLAPVAVDQAREWAEVRDEAFGMPSGYLADMSASCVGRPPWQCFGVWDGDALVSCASMYVYGEAAGMTGGSTVPSARRQGAQTALLAVRARAAADAGCRWLVSETGAEAPGTHNSSLHNMRALGFEVLYERPNWIWKPA